MFLGEKNYEDIVKYKYYHWNSLVTLANVIQWDFGAAVILVVLATYNYDSDPSTPETPRHIGGSDTDGSAYEG